MACAHHPSPAPAASWRPPWGRWKSFLLSLFLRLKRWLPFLSDLNSFLLPPPAMVKTKNIKDTSSSAGTPTNTTDTSSCSCTAMETAARLAATGKQPGGNVVKGPDGKDRVIANSFMAPPEDVAYHKKYMRAALDMVSSFNCCPGLVARCSLAICMLSP
ncbi:hypothetical protein EX30DRAFT_99553 [Ascodesmis nigricans]|uniref:Uncharacterized protein n=1 Tax=Ascodesmis nigricans TaxID=341454 RepID=A0A4S2N4J0_9PEZI|nr:hypothetical protein EX30DRAFT_99553 [Ascodesmis nigricans]